jgi:hypothetical protein
MRVLFLLAVLLPALPTRAQEGLRPEGPADAFFTRFGENVLLFYGGYAAGFFSAAGTGLMLDALGAPQAVSVPVALAAYPVGVAGGVYGVGSLMGIEGSFRNTLGDAVTGMPVGLAAGGAILWFAVRSHDGDPVASEGELIARVFEGLALALAATSVAAAVPVIWAVSDFRVAPTAFHGPAGETTPGASLLLRF